MSRHGSARSPGARRPVLGLLVALVLAAGVPAAAQPAEGWRPDVPDGWPPPPPATATAYLLLDADTGQVLAARAPDTPRVVASTVKLLTIETALRRLDLDTVVTVGDEVAVGGAGVGLAPGDRWTVEELVSAVLVRSGNDAALALAAAAGPGIDAFVGRMRAVADELGLDGAVITEPTGLDDTNRLTARHLGRLARVVLDDPGLRRLAAQATTRLPGLGTVRTRNLLLERYDGATGLKTGYTDAAGWSVVGSARRDGRELVAVVLGARTDDDRFSEAAALLDHGHGTLVADDLAPLRLRRPGGWEPVAAPDHVWVPPRVVTGTALAGTADRALELRLTADEQVLARLPVPPPTAPDPSALGARLGAALYRGMRQAHVTGAWDLG